MVNMDMVDMDMVDMDMVDMDMVVGPASHDHILTWCGRKVRRCGDSHLRLPSLESTLNLQSTFFHHLNGELSRRSRGQQPETSPTFLQHLLATAALHKVSALTLFLPKKGNPT